MPDLSDGLTQADIDLLVELGGLFDEVDPVPASVVSAARESFTWRTVDAELAELSEDSALAVAAGVRGHGDSRLLTFEAPSLTVVVEVTEIAGERRLVGQVVPAGVRHLEVRHQGGATRVNTDELGRFTVESIPRGPTSIACVAEERDEVVTSWVSI